MHVKVVGNASIIKSKQDKRVSHPSSQAAQKKSAASLVRILPTSSQLMASRGINFTGVNITQARTVKNSIIHHVFTDEFLPNIEDIHRNAYLTLEKKEDKLHLNFQPSAAHKKDRDELTQMFVPAVYSAIKEGKKLGVKSVEFITSNDKLAYITKLLEFDTITSSSGVCHFSLPQTKFDKTFKNIDKYLTVHYAKSVAKDITKVSDNLKHFEPMIISLGDLRKPKQFGESQNFYKEGGKVFIEEKADSLNVKVNGIYIGYDDSKMALTPGDMLTIDKNVYIYQQDKKTGNGQLSFIAKDDDNIYTRLFPKGISKMNLNQGKIGDCYFLAALKAMSKNPKGAEIIAKTIEQISGTHFVVRFPGCPKYSIDTHAGDFSGSASVLSSTPGVKILEHAFYKLKEKINWKGRPDIRPSTKEQWLSNGFTQEAMHILTGGKILIHETSMNPERQYTNTFLEEAGSNPAILNDAKTFLKQLHDKGENVIVAADTSISVKSDDRLIYPDHSYAITNIDPENEKISINNPHDTAQDYVFSYKQFFKHFASIKAVEI